MIRRIAAACGLAVGLALGACSTGEDAVATGGDFQFVSPGGKTQLFYDPPDKRGKVSELSGESLLEQGKTIKLSDFDGQVVVLNLWGQWCAPCRSEADDLQRVYEATKSSGVALLGIDVKDDVRSAPVDFVRDRGLTYPSLYDPPGRSLLALKGYPRTAVPSTIVLDRQHRVAAIFLAEVSDQDLLPIVRKVATEPR